MPEPRPLRDQVSVSLDGDPIDAERGEPVAVALVRAGRLAMARSPKFHRPRGPSCLRGACDGCLARVNDVPNVMTCRVPAEEGLRVETQNVAGSRETDLLRVTDWFFPEGMNHHELLAGVPGAGRVMQTLARQVAGLGRLPKEPLAAAGARRRTTDVLVVGCGPAGMAAAVALASRGREVEVVDDDLTVGGSLVALPGQARAPWEPLLRKFEQAVASGRVAARPRTTAAGIYGDDVLLAAQGGIEVATAQTLVLAPGAHDGTLAFEGNDLPGVVSARAAGRLLSHGVRPGKRTVVVCAPGSGPFGSAFAAACPDAERAEGIPSRARGSSRVRAVDIGGRTLPCDFLVIDTPRAPAYELAAQAGAKLAHAPGGYVVQTGPNNQIREAVYASGEAVGTPLDPARVHREAEAIAAAAGS